jgi:hypothetical protein
MDGRGDGIVQRISRRIALHGLGAAGVGAALAWRTRPATAQDGTPEVGCAGDPAVGDTVEVIGPDGEPVINLTITELIDPFEEYDPRGAPARGQRFAVVQLDVEAVGPRPFSLDAYAFSLQDSDGFVARPTSLTLPAETTLVPLASAALENGAVAKGFLAFSALQGVRLDRLFFIPASDRLILAADLRSSSE